MIKRGCVRVLDLCKYITLVCTRDLRPISNLQLQKILYKIQVESVLRYGTGLFVEDIEAWDFGPVVPVAYRRYSIYGGMPILETNTLYLEELERKYGLSEGELDLIDQVIEDNKESEVWSVLDETHASGSSWDVVYSSVREGCDPVISLDVIAEYE